MAVEYVHNGELLFECTREEVIAKTWKTPIKEQEAQNVQ